MIAMAKNNSKVPDGYIIPVHRSLIQPLYWMGVPRNVLLIEIFGTILGGVIFKSFFVPVVALGVHFTFKYFGSKDPDFYKVFWKSRGYKKFYDV